MLKSFTDTDKLKSNSQNILCGKLRAEQSITRKKGHLWNL